MKPKSIRSRRNTEINLKVRDGVPFLKRGDLLTGTITDLSHIGQGILHVEGFPVFIEQALVGEEVTFEIDHVGQRRAFAHVVKWHSTSPDRVETHDSIYEETGTMPLQHLSYPAQLKFKQD